MGNVSNVSAAKPKTEGCIYIGTSSSTVPESADGALTGFTSLGYVSEDGLENDYSKESNDIKEWGGSIVMSELDEQTDTWKFKLIESLNSAVLKAVYGDDNVDVGDDGEISIKAKPIELPILPFVIDMILADDKAKRVCIPKGKITALETISYKRDEPIGYEITITAYPATDGSTHDEYIK